MSTPHRTFEHVPDSGGKKYQCKRCPEVVTERLATRADARLAHAAQTDTEETP